MTVTLQIYDELRSAVLFDCNDPSGTNSGLYGSVTTKLSSGFDVGAPVLQSSQVSPDDIDATFSAFSKRASATMKLKLIIAGASYDALTTAVGTLAQYLTQGCTMKYVPGSTTYLFDVLPSSTPRLLAGGELAIYRAAALFQTDIDVELQRQPYMRGSALTAATNLLANSTPLRDSNGDGTPDSWTILSTPTLTIAPTTQSLHVVAGAATRGVYQATGAASASSAQVWTLSADVKVTSGTAALRLDWRTAAAANISNSDQTTTTATWARVSVTGTAPATTDHIRATLISSGAAATFDVRNVQLELASAASTYRVKSETVSLDPAASGFAKMISVVNPGTAPSPMTITAAYPDASSAAQAMDYWLASSDATPGGKYLSDYLNGPFYAQAEASGNGWTITFGTNTSNVAGTDATFSGSDFATITHAVDPTTYNKRITFTRTTLVDCLRGSHRVFAAVKPESKTNYRLQLAWSAGSATTEVNAEFLLQQTNNTSVARVLCDLGTVELPENTGVTINGLVMELWTKMGTGKAAANLDVDYLMLVPQDNAAHVELPDLADAATQITDGADLQIPKDLGAGDPTWTAGTTIAHRLKLSAANQAGGIGSTTTGAFTGTTGGVHDVAFSVNLSNFIGTVNLEVANLSDNDLLDSAGNSLSLSYVYSTAANVVLTPTIRVNEELSDLYQPRVTITAYTSGSLEIPRLTVTPVNVIAVGQQVRTDPGSTGLDRYAAERLDSSSFYVAALTADRVPFWIPPGLSLLWLESYDGSVGGVELPHLNARTLTVTPTVYPRYWA